VVVGLGNDLLFNFIVGHCGHLSPQADALHSKTVRGCEL
jgi:hypothetical protein